MTTGFRLDTLNQAIGQHRSTKGKPAYLSDRGNQHLSIRNSKRLEEAEIKTRVDNFEDSCGNPFADGVTGLLKTEFQAPRTAELRLPGWVGSPEWARWDNRRLLHLPADEAEDDAFRWRKNELEKAAQVLNKNSFGKAGTIQSPTT